MLFKDIIKDIPRNEYIEIIKDNSPEIDTLIFDGQFIDMRNKSKYLDYEVLKSNINIEGTVNTIYLKKLEVK